jgi:hypothetical protein
MISTLVAVNKTEQPASQNWPMDSKEVEARSGTIWMWRAAGGSIGRSSSPSCVDVIVVPLGVVMVIGDEVGRLWRMGAEMVPKCAVQPVSAMAEWEEEWEQVVWVGGPSAVLLWREDELTCKQHGVFWTTNSVFTLVGC